MPVFIDLSIYLHNYLTSTYLHLLLGGYSKIARVLSLDGTSMREVSLDTMLHYTMPYNNYEHFHSFKHTYLMISKCVSMFMYDSSVILFPQECILGSHNNTITDIAWAPSMGRSYHMIATASRESTFKVDRWVDKCIDKCTVV